MKYQSYPRPEGLYHPRFEHDGCGIGFVADVLGRPSHDMVDKGIEILVNLTHRGAVGSDPDTGDGAGILMQLPDAFFREHCAQQGFDLPRLGQYAVGVLFLPGDAAGICLEIFEEQARACDLKVLGWRQVPVNPEALGVTAREACPRIEQVFLQGPPLDARAFERKLFLARRLTEKAVAEKLGDQAGAFYIPSLSSRTINYKGMMVGHQIKAFYPDLECPELSCAIAVVHQRYSTNTFPSWPLAQPFRMMGHNGEINTLRGNINKMTARHGTMTSEVWGEDLERLLPIIQEGGSDSACFDNMLEMLVLSGRSLPHAILMMIPEAWGTKYYMGHDRRGFFEYHANFMEPWDGPASMTFTDGLQVGCILDRNGLRPARYLLTKDNLLVLASETGVLDISPSEVKRKGRLQPGKMLLVDTARQRLLTNDEVKAEICRQRPYRRWVAANRLEVENFKALGEIYHIPETLLTRQLAFGYTREDLELLIRPMASDSKEPVGSMGNDAPLAVLSDKPQLLFSYFKQYFAQVTNPPIDPIREDLVMSLTSFLGREGNILEETPDHARRLKIFSPILTGTNLRRIRNTKFKDLENDTLDICFKVSEGEKGLERAMEKLYILAEERIAAGCSILILSDGALSMQRAPIPSLLAVSGLHQHLIRKGLRNRVGLVLESGEPREVNHFALLLSFGVDAISPYLAFECVSKLHSDGRIAEPLSPHDAQENYITAIGKGILKIISKMGISTLRSYRGAQVYEALGLGRELIDKYFPNTVSRIGGIGIELVAREALMRHQEAYGSHRGRIPSLPEGGNYSYRRTGERHLWSPESIHYLQQATRRNHRALYEQFAGLINNQERRHTTLRSLFEFKSTGRPPLPLAEVEPAGRILSRFVTGAMSFGSLSPEAHETLAIAMNRMKGMSNSGEGGEDPARYEPMENGDSRMSAIKQIASGRFGVTIEYLVNARELQIKIAQGAKPGEGGQLPGHKVNGEIARVRNSTPGVSLISPPPHHDIYSIEDLAQLIFDLKNANPRARISVKLVSECGVGTIAAGVTKGHADMVLISGGDGGTGASPLSSVKSAGLPWELGLAETHQTLVLNDLRGRVRLQTDGQLRTGRDLAVAILLGAEEFGFGTAALIVLGCVMMRKCHLNTCPVGVATQDPRCRARFTGKPEYLINYFNFVAEELRELMAGLGFRTVDEMVGRSELLGLRPDITHWKAATLDCRALFHVPGLSKDVAVHRVIPQEHGIDTVLDYQLIADCRAALEEGRPVKMSYDIGNANRTTGAMLSGEIARRYGLAGLPEDTIQLRFKGSAGQSFGAFAARGLTLLLQGDANDYVGKGLSGGKIILAPPRASTFDPAENVIAGNTLLYGATAGEAYFGGLTGERFGVRNSGARVVVEGVGDHGCEYMTGGVVAVLGSTGVNFAAGMSGGIAYVYDPQQDFDLRCNLDMVDLEPLIEEEDIETLRKMIEQHYVYTDSRRAEMMLHDFERILPLFVKVMPIEYRRALGKMSKVDLEARKTEAEKVEQA